MSAYEDALAGREVEVDFTAIEKTLSELWRGERDADEALTRAALWNVVAHSSTDPERARSAEVTGRASAKVPQRTILVRASVHEKPHISAWISANCHLVGGGKQMCSEEISIVAGGDRVHRIPPLVEALLLPNVPVAAWWIGDLPSDEAYLEALLDPVDRLVVDSSEFNNREDLRVLSMVAKKTGTWPSDLNWARLHDWRSATATIFDDSGMLGRLGEIESIRIVASSSGILPDRTQAMIYLAWIAGQGGYAVAEDGSISGQGGPMTWSIEDRDEGSGHGALLSVDLGFRDGTAARIVRKDQDKALRASFGAGWTTVTHLAPTSLEDLLVNQLTIRDDAVFTRLLAAAEQIARRLE